MRLRKISKRLLAVVICMTMLVQNASSISASDATGEDAPIAAYEVSEQTGADAAYDPAESDEDSNDAGTDAKADNADADATGADAETVRADADETGAGEGKVRADADETGTGEDKVRAEADGSGADEDASEYDENADENGDNKESHETDDAYEADDTEVSETDEVIEDTDAEETDDCEADHARMYLKAREYRASKATRDSSLTTITNGLDYNKTSKVLDWDDRTYTIEIDALSKTVEKTTTTKDNAVDIMLVVDVSGSMRYRGDMVGQFSKVYDELDKNITYLYKEANALDTDDTLTNTYYLYYSAEKGYWIRETLEHKSKTQTMPNRATGYVYYSRMYQAQDTLNSFVNTVAAQSPESRVGLVTFSTSATFEYFDEMSEANRADLVEKIYAMTPDGGTSPNEGLDQAYIALKQYETDGRKKYVIMFTDGEPTGNSDTWKDSVADASEDSAEKVKEIGADTDAETKLYTIALNPSTKAEEWLQSSIASSGCAISIDEMSALDVVFAKIVDEISNYVDIKDAVVVDILAAEFELTETGKKQLAQSGATWLENDDGTTTIAWENVTIPCDEKISYSFEVKAKDPYIGGNNVYTNDSASAIYANNTEYKLPMPKVNVKADIDANDVEKTIFLGDTVPMSNDILTSLSVFTQNGEYEYKWYTDASCTDEIGQADIASATPEIEGATYYLKVSYVSEKPENTALANTADHYVGEGTTGYSVYAIGTYQINVVDGAITIEKTISKSSYNAFTGDAIFTFKITDGNMSYYRTLRFTEAAVADTTGDKVTLSVTVTGLAAGNYTVEELSTAAYTLDSVAVDGLTTFEYRKMSDKVTFVAGDITKRYGKVTFSNVKKDTDTPKKSDVIKNTLKVGSKIESSTAGDNGTGNDRVTDYLSGN